MPIRARMRETHIRKKKVAEQKLESDSKLMLVGVRIWSSRRIKNEIGSPPRVTVGSNNIIRMNGDGLVGTSDHQQRKGRMKKKFKRTKWVALLPEIQFPYKNDNR